MPVYSSSTAVPRNEIAASIVQGSSLNAGNIWSQVLPPYPVNKRTSHLLKATVQGVQLGRILTDKYITQPGANIERMNMTIGDDTFTVIIRKREVKIPDEVDMDYADYLSIESLASRTGAINLELTNEYLAANAIFNTTNFGNATNSGTAYTVGNLATSNPISDIFLSIERVRDKGEQPNTIIIPTLVWQRMRQMTLVKAAAVSTNGFSPISTGNVTTDSLLAIFAPEGIEKILIGRSRYNTAVDGATPAYTKMWLNTYIWVGRTGASFVGGTGNDGYSGLQTVEGAGAMTYWDAYTPVNGWMTETYRDEAVESNIVRTKTSASPYIANGNAGDLIATQYS
jgi:hypothetical protein